MAVWLRVLYAIVAAALQLVVLDAAVRTFLLPRVAKVRLSHYLGHVIGGCFRMVARANRSYAVRDRILSMYASMVLLGYQTTWLGLSVVAFAFAFMASGVDSFARAFEISGSSLLTLGTASGSGAAQVTLGFIEAGVGLTLLALLIAFIPTLYAAFQRREISVSRLTVRAGMPATPWGVLEMAQSVNSYERLDELWREWEQWFIEVGETHTTLTILNFYRSPEPEQTWITSAANVLDAAALFNAAVDLAPSPTAGLCIRSGWLTLRRISDYFQVPYPQHPNRDTPISISREEFDGVLERLERSGVALLSDRDAAWSDFVGWRANYDAMIEAFYELFTCPRTDWTLARAQPLFGPSNKRGV
ncbi:MAG: hypothetical protein ACYC19_04025 [Acidimicrobiales bacterium]